MADFDNCAYRSERAGVPALAKEHDHDFGTGRAPCTICNRTAAELGVRAGGKNVTPGANDDGYRVGERNEEDEIAKTGRDADDWMRERGKYARLPMGASDQSSVDTLGVATPLGIFDGLIEFATGGSKTFDNDVDEQRINRMDVVADLWTLARRPGEDDASLGTRIRRQANRESPARVKFIASMLPPAQWNPPPGFKLGADWRSASAILPAREILTIDQEVDEK
jgi:hypothetical protein